MSRSGFTALTLTAAIAAVLLLVANSNSDGESEAAFNVDQSPNNFNFLNVGDMVDISQNGIDALKSREGCSLRSYPDHKGRSIGYGHLIKFGESIPEPITQETADALFSGDIVWAVNAVADNVVQPITQNQFDALVSFVYNVGETAFLKSTLLTKINAGDLSAVSEFARWCRASGVVNDSLVTRRESEVRQYLA